MSYDCYLIMSQHYNSEPEYNESMEIEKGTQVTESR